MDAKKEQTQNSNSENPFFKNTLLIALKEEISQNDKLPRTGTSHNLNRDILDAALLAGLQTGIIKPGQGVGRLIEAGLILFTKATGDQPKQVQLVLNQTTIFNKTNLLVKVEDMRPEERLEFKTVKMELASLLNQLEFNGVKRPDKVKLMKKLQKLVPKAIAYAKTTQDPDIGGLLARADKCIA